MARRYTTLEMLERLIAFNTISSRSNLPIIDFIEAYLNEWGITAYRTVSAEGDKSNLWATIGPQNLADGVVLSGHTDVVPVVDQNWSSDPFALTNRDGKLYGRGTADMKTFIAIVLAHVPDMLQQPLRTPLHFAFSYDEEPGCHGVPHLIADVAKRFPRPKLVIVGEPTEMNLVVAHKGCHVFETVFAGRAAHSSAPQLGANAIVAAAQAVLILQEMADELKHAAPKDSPFDPPHTTIGVATIDGGAATNIVPERCHLRWDLRNLPDVNPDDIVAEFNRRCADLILPQFRHNASEASIQTKKLAGIPPLRPETDSPAAELIRLLTGQNDSHAVSYGTEGGLFQAAGLSSVICGPGNIAQAHQPDEFITLLQVTAGEDFIKSLISWARA